MVLVEGAVAVRARWWGVRVDLGLAALSGPVLEFLSEDEGGEFLGGGLLGHEGSVGLVGRVVKLFVVGK